MDFLMVEPVDDEDVLDRVFLYGILRKYLTDREHAVLALRASGYTRANITTLLGIGKTTIYNCERKALAKLQAAYQAELELADD